MIRTRESLRRKALWTLSRLMPSDPRAAALLDVLDDIEAEERIDFNAPAYFLSGVELHVTGLSTATGA